MADLSHSCCGSTLSVEWPGCRFGSPLKWINAIAGFGQTDTHSSIATCGSYLGDGASGCIELGQDRATVRLYSGATFRKTSRRAVQRNEGRAGYASPINRVPANAPHLIADLPLSNQSDIPALDIQWRDLSPLAGRLIVVHSRGDPITPSARARRSRELRPTPNIISSIPLPTWLSDRATLWMR